MGEHPKEFEPARKGLIKVTSDYGGQPEISVNPEAGLFLFDLDGTLVDIRPFHGQTLVKRYLEVVPKFAKLQDAQFQEEFKKFFYTTFGKGLRHPQQDIIRERFNIPATDEQLDKVTEGYGQIFARLLSEVKPDDREKYVLPGVRKMLNNIKNNKHPAAIVTGNTEETARVILKEFGFADFFITGGYAEDVPADADPESKRPYILQTALRRLKEKNTKLDFLDGQTIDRIMIVGDTPSDAAAALWQGKKISRAFIVSTGDFRLEELKASRVKPDLAGKSMDQLPESLKS